MQAATYDDLIVSDLIRGYADAERLLRRDGVAEVWSEISVWPADRLRLAMLAAVSALDEPPVASMRP